MPKRAEVQPGERIGRWTVLECYLDDGHTRVHVQCACGDRAHRSLGALRYAERQGYNPGCRACGRLAKRRVVVEPGERYGSWTVIGEAPGGRHPNGTAYRRVHVRCDCGTKATVRLFGLRYGRSTKCRSCRDDSRRTRLTAAHERVLRAFLSDGDATMQEVADRLGVTRQRVGQIVMDLMRRELMVRRRLVTEEGMRALAAQEQEAAE